MYHQATSNIPLASYQAPHHASDYSYPTGPSGLCGSPSDALSGNFYANHGHRLTAMLCPMGLYPGSEFKLAADPTGTDDPAALAAGTWPAFLTDNAIYHRIATPVEDQLTHFKMEPNQDDLAAQEAAAREYQPDLAGPLVGEKTASEVIKDEYAKADPVYVEKTINLPETFSHYRPIQGDGNCGWRAIAFGYFETLIDSGDKSLIKSECARIASLNDYIRNVGGIDEYVYEDMVVETCDLLEKISMHVDEPEEAMRAVMDAFNDLSISNQMVYHFRLLASSYLKGNAETYVNFIVLDSGIQGYCETVVERHGIEIEHVGVMALANVLLKPIGFVLEVAYLDRSPGSQTNQYRFPEEANLQQGAPLGPCIYLLYRPDHYDILYRRPPVEISVHRALIHQFTAASNTLALNEYTGLDMDILSMIPGCQSFGGPMEDFHTSDPQMSWVASPSPFEGGPTSAQHFHARSDFAMLSQVKLEQQSFQASRAEFKPHVEPYQSPPRFDPKPARGPASQEPAAPQQSHEIRFMRWCQEPRYTETLLESESSTRRPDSKQSSIYYSHFNNPHFQPEQYSPPTDGGRVLLHAKTPKKRTKASKAKDETRNAATGRAPSTESNGSSSTLA